MTKEEYFDKLHKLREEYRNDNEFIKEIMNSLDDVSFDNDDVVDDYPSKTINRMTRNDFLTKLASLNFQIKMLKDAYITSNNCIPEGSYVIVTCEGKEERLYLKEYKIVNGYIKPIFNTCYKDGKRGPTYMTKETFPGNITMRLA